MVFTWLLWNLFFTATFQSPFELETLSEGTYPLEAYESPHSSYYRLPMFRHAPGPLVDRELFQPVPYRKQFPRELDALLLPPTHQDHTFQQPSGRAVDVWCGLGTISVRVDRYQLGAWLVPSLIYLGSCRPIKVDHRYVYFHHSLTECQGVSKVVGGQLVYTFFLRYTPPSQDYVIRFPPLNLPIQCHYNRFHYSYKVGYRPEFQPKTFLKSIRNKHVFSLTVYNAQWKPLLPGDVVLLGQPIYFVAQTSFLLAGERLYVDSCYISPSQDPNSTPKLDIISNFGCMTDSRREGSSSRFLSAGGREVLFTVDSFLFSGVAQLLFLHCSMSVSLSTSQSSKSCSYNNNLGRWEELEGPLSTCICCDSVCTDMQDSVKYTSSKSSPGLYGGHYSEVHPSMRARSFQFEKENEEDDVEQKMDEKLEEKGDQFYQPIIEICHEEKDPQKKKACIIAAEKKEKSRETIVSQPGNASAVMAATTTTTLATSANDVKENRQDASTAVIQDCSNGDALSCQDTNITAKDNVRSSNNEHSYIRIEDVSGLESTIIDGLLKHKLENLTSKKTEPPSFNDITPKSNVHLVDFIDSAHSIGPDKNMVQSLQREKLDQSTLPVEFRDPVWVAGLLGSNLSPQVDDESPYQSQITGAMKTQKRDSLDVFPRLASVGSHPVGPDQMSSPSHSAIVTFVSASQGTESLEKLR